MKKPKPQPSRRPERPAPDSERPIESNNQLPIEVKESLSKVFQDSLQEILPPEKARQATERLTAHLPQIVKITATKTHIGPMPSVEVAAGYEQLLPGSIERMFKMAERDQEAYIESHAEKLRRDDRFRLFSLTYGGFALIAILAVVILLVKMGQPWVAASVAGLGVTGIIAAFVNAWRPSKVQEPKGKPSGKG